ncbi:MAG TPA: mandelate racemase/muconate lactonizing enzyme family protein [Rhizomicrobium sp.]|nr:mandelate racemase/muconate lactonizing enzyme family protein [Rhizomicrobium sp.]
MSIFRRDFLRGAGIAPLALGMGMLPAGAKAPARTGIAGLEVFRVHVNRRGDWVIPRLKTEGGLTGLGDASQSGNDEQTLVWLKRFVDLLKGHSVFEIAWFRQASLAHLAEGGKPAAVAASALEHALWDLQGQALGLPVYELFGGRIQDRIRIYANINRSSDPRTPDGFAAMAQRAVADGFDAFKLAPFDELPLKLADPAERARLTQNGLDCAAAVRRTIGPDRDLLIDAHSRFHLEEGLELAQRFEPLKLFWLEEVTPAKPVSDLAAINKAAAMPTAGGENIQGVAGFYPYIRAEAVDIVMPDVKVCGGLLELKKIAALAEGAGLFTSPHGPASPIGNLAAAHVVATIPNFNILEFSYGEVPWRAELIDPPEQIDRSALVLSARPGFGVRLNEKTAAKYAVPV